MIHRCCPICSEKNIKNIKKISFQLEQEMPNYYYLSKCNKCGFIYANTPATKEDYNEYYKISNMYESLPMCQTSSLELYKQMFNIVEKYIEKTDRVLDMGCGPGKLLKIMKDSGYTNLTGVDPAKGSIEKLIELGINGWVGDIYEKPKEEYKNKYDVIILSGVLEHLYDLKDAFETFKLYLKPKGKIICIVPNTTDYFRHDFPLAHYVNIEHINHFSLNSLIKIFEKNNFSILEALNLDIYFKGTVDPGILAVFENINVKDCDEDKINQLLFKIKQREEKNNQLIEEMNKNQDEVIIFGSGNFARSMLKNSKLENLNIICFVDNNSAKWGNKFCGYEIKSPEILKNFKGKILILVMIGSEEISKQIKEMNLDSEIIILK